jgi:hypothetical protein
MGWRLLSGAPRFLRRPLTIAGARSELEWRRRVRVPAFLDLVRRGIYARPASPYLALLRHARCELGDVERLVYRDGIEAALRHLHRAGVHLTVDEFKGRRPVRRSGLELAVDPRSLRNPLAIPAVWGATSGSRGAAAGVPIDLAAIRERAVDTYLALDARGGAGWRNAVWGAPGLAPTLWYSLCGGPVDRWFSQLDPTLPGIHPRYRWSVRALRATSRLGGVRLPTLETAPLRAPLPIARWMSETLRAGDVPHLWAMPSSALRLARAAGDAGIDVAGARLTVTGEPVTASRLDALRAAGFDAVPDYGCADSGGPLSHGCLAPEAADEVHFFDDLHALVGGEGPGFPAGALLVTSLRPTAPLLLFNVSMGDRAVVGERRCGCPLEALGWTTHLHTIRSYEKLTAGGMTFLDTDVIDVLDEILPARFGGAPADYQLVEEEAADGQPRLRLRVAPAAGELDEAALAEGLLEAIAAASPTARVMAEQWRDGGFLTVERADPLATRTGKILHLRSSPAGAVDRPAR